MNVSAIINARRTDDPGLCTIRLAGGRIASIDPQAEAATPADSTVIDAGGGLVTPSHVDAHLHIDRVFTFGLAGANRSGTIDEADALWARIREQVTPEDVQRRATRAIRTEIEHGTGLFRGQVEVSTAAGLRLCEGALAAREQAGNDCKMQLVAYPHEGLVRDAGAVEVMRQALRAGLDIVGGRPDVEASVGDGRRHLELVFDLAAEFGTTVDVHVDECNNPHSRYIEHLADLTRERGLQGRVTASHASALSRYAAADAARVLDRLAEARVAVITTPAVETYVLGRGDGYPRPARLTRLRELLDREILCAAGQERIQDVRYPFGKGQMLEQAWLLAHVEQMATPSKMQRAAEMICCQAGDVLGVGQHRTIVRALANLTVWPVSNVVDLLRLRPRPMVVLHGGRGVATNPTTDDARLPA